MKSILFLKRSLLTYLAMIVGLFIFLPAGTPALIANNGESERKGEEMGKKPWVFDIEKETLENPHYRAVKWTGKYMQLVFMSLEPGEIIDLEIHEDHDQFIRIEKGKARILMGKTEDALTFDEEAVDDFAVLVPAGYWHEVRNIGDSALKLYTLYAPPEHAPGLIHERYDEAAQCPLHHAH